MPVIDTCPIVKDPFPHQLERWRRYRDVPAWGHLWEQGTGKSAEIIMQAIWLFMHGEIDGILLLAPNGVHRNFVTDQMPEHWPKELGSPTVCWYRSKSAESKWHQSEIEACIQAKGFAVLAMSYDALCTDAGKAWAKKFLQGRKIMIVADESSRIKTPTAIRTRLAFKAAEFAKYRRILNGTPVPNGPFDIYAQIKFLDPQFWVRHGINSFTGFKAQFGEWGKGFCYGPNGTKREYPELLCYRNLDLLNKMLAEITDRVLKEDVLPDLPPKLYKTLRYDLTAAQRRVYDSLKDESLAFLDSGEVVTTPIVLTKLLRLQQVCCGYVAIDDPLGEPIVSIGADNPRLDILMEVCEDLGHKAIIWTRFRRDVDLILERMKKADLKAVRYDGAVDDDDRKVAVESFQRGDIQFFVSNPAAGGEGLTLLGDQREGMAEALACKTCIYYSNSFNLQHRLQSEDRAHRIGQRWPVQYIDIVASGTMDEQVSNNLRDKFDVAQQVTGDRLRAWLS
ncbi:MAG: DEAD/DEAH box helicase [Phycisphaerales bacterium]|nr:DEAD/DEAH box helicase [Phycisphaerales bacterium]